MRHSEKTMRKMLLALLEQEDFATRSSLSQTFGISKRSVQNYLNRADGWLAEHQLLNIRIVKKQGYGIRLELGEADRQTLATLLNNQYFTLADGSADRRIELLRSLIFSREELTIQFQADSFYASRFVILSDLDWAENWLAQYRLRLFKTQGRGIGVAGDEVARRSAIAGFFDLCERREPAAVGQADPVRLAKDRLEKMEQIYTEEDTVGGYDIVYYGHPMLAGPSCFPSRTTVDIQIKNPPTVEADFVRYSMGFLSATTVHVGPYDTLSETYEEIIRWAGENGHILGTDALEDYQITNQMVSDPSLYVTQVYIPLAGETI